MKSTREEYKPAEKLELKDVKPDFPKVFRKITCPSCAQDVPADHMDLSGGIAKCSSCHVIFSIEEEVKIVKTRKETKQEIIRPEGIDLFYYKDDLDIAIKPHIQGLDAFGLGILPIFAVFLIFIYFVKGIPVFWPIAFTLGALYFVFKAFNYANYRTYINLNREFVSIQVRPKNFRKDKTYATRDIDQIYLKHSGDGSGYGIHMIVDGPEGQKHVKLFSVNTLSKAKYLEQEIEKYLEITDREVPEANA